MSQLKVDSVVPSGGVVAGASGGGIIQVVSVTKTDASTESSNSTETLIPGLEATITPRSANNKVLVQVVLHCMVAGSFGGQYAVIKRGSTNIAIGDAAGSRNRATLSLQAPQFNSNVSSNSFGPGCATLIYLDSPATTSATTYGLYHADANGTNNLYVNRSLSDSNNNGYNRVASSITLMEVCG